MFRFSLLCFTVVPALVAAQPARGFKHIVLVVQENRTPDNLFGSNAKFEPNVDIATSGLNSKGQTVKLQPQPLASCWDPQHFNSSFKAMYDNGRMDGADLIKVVSRIPHCQIVQHGAFSYADNSAGAVQPYFDIATQYGWANRMFQTNQGPSYPAHQFLFGATSAPTDTSPFFAAEDPTRAGACNAAKAIKIKVIDQQGNEDTQPPVAPCFARQTMATTLDAAGVMWRYYPDKGDAVKDQTTIWNAPSSIKAICGQPSGKLLCGSQYYATHAPSGQNQALADIQHCALAGVSWVIPTAAESDHAGSTLDTGPSWVASIVNAIGEQTCGSESYWKDTAILITWDDWGGWYDHVPPPLPNGQPSGWGQGYTYGFRVPLLVVSAYTPAGYVDNDNHDFGSLLAFVESNFGLQKIGPGTYADAYADNLAKFFTLSAPRNFTHIHTGKTADYFLHAKQHPLFDGDD